MAASTLPALILGGGGPGGLRRVGRARSPLPTVRGLVIGRSLLYPADDDVAAAVDIATGLVMA